MTTYAPPATVLPSETPQRPTAGPNVECDHCKKVYTAAAVVSGPVKQCLITLTFSRTRTLHCDHCNLLQKWTEACTRSGRLTGFVIVKPIYLRDPGRIARFLLAHPEAAGVADAAQ